MRNECGTYHIRSETPIFTGCGSKLWHVPHFQLSPRRTTWRSVNFNFFFPSELRHKVHLLTFGVPHKLITW